MFFTKLKQICFVLLTVHVGFCFAELVAEYNFEDDGTGYFGTDATDNNLDANYELVNFVPGFDGTSLDYAPKEEGENFTAPQDPAFDLGVMTLEAWFWPQFPFDMNVINKWAAYQDDPDKPESRSYALNLLKGKPSFSISPDGSDTILVQSVIYPLWGDWNHFVGTFDGVKMCIYMNGVLIAERDVPIGFMPHVGEAPLRVGIDGDGNAPTRGKLDIIRIYNHALSADDVAARYGEFINQQPVANAGEDQTARVGEEVVLTGSGSDPDNNNPLTYAWSFVERPVESVAELSDPASATTTFEMDKMGDYVVQLIVTDAKGLASEPDLVTVSGINAAPVADAGENQAATIIGEPVQLDGSQSNDPDGDLLSYLWEIVSAPVNSQATLDDPESMQPTFIPDEYGTYVFSLVVHDGWVESAPDEVSVSFENVAPIADAGENQSCVINEAVVLEGSGSDQNGDELTYNWQLVSFPDGSEAIITDPTDTEASIVPDVAGEYVISLTVNDGTVDSDPSLVTVVAVSYNDALTDILREAICEVKSIPRSHFRCRRMKKILTKIIYINMMLADRGRYRGAYMQMRYGIIRKLDGCERNGCPDRNDWIRKCESQELVYPLLVEAKELLAEILNY